MDLSMVFCIGLWSLLSRFLWIYVVWLWWRIDECCPIDLCIWSTISVAHASIFASRTAVAVDLVTYLLYLDELCIWVNHNQDWLTRLWCQLKVAERLLPTVTCEIACMLVSAVLFVLVQLTCPIGVFLSTGWLRDITVYHQSGCPWKMSFMLDHWS